MGRFERIGQSGKQNYFFEEGSNIPPQGDFLFRKKRKEDQIRPCLIAFTTASVIEAT